MDFIKKLEIGIEEILLIFLILIELLDFFGVIPPELEFIEKTTALIAMTYLFYKASITKVIFGKREKFFDKFIVISWFLISINTVIGFVISAGDELLASSNFYLFIARNFFVIERVSFATGTILLMVCAFLLIHEKIKKPCLMQIIHEETKVKDFKHKILRFTIIYLVLLAFYLLVYSFAIEWLAITVDAPIIVLVSLTYLIIIIKKQKNIETSTLLEHICEKAELFYEKFISLFHTKKTILIAVSGILVLHLLVEIGHFIIPYLTTVMYTWYFKQMGGGHIPIWQQLSQDLLISTSLFHSIGIFLIYTLNIIAILLLFLTPAYIWYNMWHKKIIKLKPWMFIFFGSVVALIMTPTFKMSKINSKVLMGVDITTQQIPFLENVWIIICISFIISIIFYFLGKNNIHKTTKVAFFISLVYFGYYLYLFFTDLFNSYVGSIISTAQNNMFFTSFHLLIFLSMTLAFYTLGFFAFVYESLWKQKV